MPEVPKYLFPNGIRIHLFILSHLIFFLCGYIIISDKVVFQVVICSDFSYIGFLGLPMSIFSVLGFCNSLILLGFLCFMLTNIFITFFF